MLRKFLHWYRSVGPPPFLPCPCAASRVVKANFDGLLPLLLSKHPAGCAWLGGGRAGSGMHPEGTGSQHAARLAELDGAVDFNGLVGFVCKQVRTPCAGISVTSGSPPSSKSAPRPRTASPGPQRRGSWSAARTTSGGAGATSVRISTAAPRSRSRRKGPERSRSPRRPRPPPRSRPYWSAGLLA